MNGEIKIKLKELPQKSGVYLMLDKRGEVIYVGKAVNLKNRVGQYFHASLKTEKTLKLVENIVDFKYILTKNEVDALVLENNLIKQYSPKYNILLKDDKAYPFIKINTKEEFPKVEVVRKLVNDGSKYFGPYMVGVSARDIIELIQSAFMIRNCTTDLSRLPKSHRPCLMSHIGRCYAPCGGGITKGEYLKIINDVLFFLKGNDRHIGEVLTAKMHAASDRLDFESALYYKNQLHTLDKLIRQQISALPKNYNMDIFSVYDNGVYNTVSVLIVRGGKLTGGDNYPVEGFGADGAADGGNTVAEINGGENLKADINGNLIEQFILQYYSEISTLPDEIVVNVALPSENALEKLLFRQFDKKINIVLPQRGIRKQLVEMAENNAKNYLETFVIKHLKKYNMTEGAVKTLKEELNLKSYPRRIECFDISHISGSDVVASMVVFIDGEPKRKLYRRFKLKVDQNNDFFSMRETVLRRLKRMEAIGDESFSEAPDLIVIDGGKGQLSAAREAMREAGRDFEMIALAEREERIFFPDSEKGILLPARSSAVALLQRVRDEAHRFAVDYHIRLRNRHLQFSELKTIEGIGDKKLDILYKHFKTIDKIKAASEDGLSAVKGISKTDAAKIRAHFQKKE